MPPIYNKGSRARPHQLKLSNLLTLCAFHRPSAFYAFGERNVFFGVCILRIRRMSACACHEGPFPKPASGTTPALTDAIPAVSPSQSHPVPLRMRSEPFALLSVIICIIPTLFLVVFFEAPYSETGNPPPGQHRKYRFNRLQIADSGEGGKNI